jgi:predicted O-linked N-acetylglucosamine transferase (SPINDLY family)
VTTASQLLFERAITAHRKGAVAEARSLYHEALRADPAHAAAYGNLAIIAAQQGDFRSAEALFRQAVKFNPGDAAAHNHLGSVLQQQGRCDEAIVLHRRAIALDPGYAQAHLALGNAQRQLGDGDGAMLSYRSALTARPDFAEAHNNIATLLQAQGSLEAAASAYRQAIAVRPSYAEAEFNLGTVLHLLGELDAAAAAYRRVIALNPAVAAAHNNLGTVLRDQGLPDAALAAFEQAIGAQADYAEAFFNRGVVLQQQARFEDALGAYGRAVALRPDHVDAVNNAGIVLQELGRPREAIALYRRVARPVAAHADLYNNLGTALLAEGQPAEAGEAFAQALACRRDFPQALTNLGNALREQGLIAEAMSAWARALDLRADDADAFSQLAYHRSLACEWASREADQEKLVAMVRDGARVPPFYLFSTPATAADQLRCAEAWIRPLRPPPDAVFQHGVPRAKPRIRLGYLSGDLHQHATAHLMAELFESHDRNRFEVAAYSYGADDGSPMRARLVNAFDRFVDIAALSHREAAQCIHADGVDILIDLKGYTHGARPAIAAFRPAPIQVSYLGYPATMGADFIDYVLVDRLVVLENQQACFSERLVHLPVCYQPCDRKRDLSAARSSRQDWGLPEQGLVLCCFNNSYKLSPVMFDIWMRLLKATPGSVLWLLETNALMRANLREEAVARGVDPDRLVFAPLVASPVHLERHRHADLFLDTAPCNAHTTASDALWCGVPVLTLSQQTFASRVAGSLLTAIGLEQLVTSSFEDYERMAAQLVADPGRLRTLRTKIETERDDTALFDLPKLTGSIEAAYERMWRRWLSGARPEPFSV